MDTVVEIINLKISEIDITTVGEGNQTIQGTWQKKGKLYILLSIDELMNNDNNLSHL